VSGPACCLQRPILIRGAKIQEVFYFASIMQKIIFFVSGFQLKRAVKVREKFVFQNNLKALNLSYLLFCQKPASTKPEIFT
jgi:hypothetical protein